MNKNLPTRRQVIAGAAVLGLLGTASKALPQTPPTPAPGSDATRTSLHQEIDLHASPQRLYQVLLDSKLFSAFSGEDAQISREEGGAFSMFGGMIVGRNVELLADQRIVQAWRPTHWAAGIYSLVRFEFKAQGANTTLLLDHTGFPEGEFAGLNYGWGKKYWKPLESYLAAKPNGNDKASP